MSIDPAVLARARRVKQNDCGGLSMSSMATIKDFLAQKRIAVVGVSHDPKDFSRGLLRTLLQHGYDAVAVNPALQSADGAPCFGSLAQINPPVDGVLVMTSPAVTDQ